MLRPCGGNEPGLPEQQKMAVWPDCSVVLFAQLVCFLEAEGGGQADRVGPVPRLMQAAPP